MESNVRELCYKHYVEEQSTHHKMKFLDILIETLQMEKVELQKVIDGPEIDVVALKRGKK